MWAGGWRPAGGSMPDLQNTPPGVSIITLGCKVNQQESEALLGGLTGLGFVQAPSHAPARLCVINTCTVTAKAAMQSRQAIRRAIRENPDAVIIATGCHAQSDPRELADIKGLDHIVANSDKHRLPGIAAAAVAAGKTPTPVIVHRDIRAISDVCGMGASVPAVASRTRPFIKIQDGCDQFCTYCIVPYTRGPSRSLSEAAVIRAVQGLPADKTAEIVLTGIHLGRYGLDLQPAASLLGLLRRLKDLGTIGRVRLSSIEPHEWTDALIAFAAQSQWVCRHFHLPLQSGDPGILKRMNRPYSPAFFVSLAHKILKAMPDAAIGVDVMAGFPGETEACFLETRRLLEALPIAYLHVFPFSPRPGTPAAGFPGRVKDGDVKTRANDLLRLGKAKKAAFYAKMTGREMTVLLERQRDGATGMLTGLTSNYIRVVAPGGDSLKGRLAACRLTGPSGPNAMRGEFPP